MRLLVTAGGQEELVVLDHAGAVGQHARAQLFLGGGLERIPDDPGVDRAALESGACVRRREVDHVHVAVGHARALQLLDQQVVHVRALVQGDLPALQVGHAQRRILAPGWPRWRAPRLAAHVHQRRACRLGEDRRGLAHRAEVDRAHVQAFQQLRAGGELGPLHRHALLGQALVQRAQRLDDGERAVFLKADAQRLAVLRLRGRRQQRRAQQASRPRSRRGGWRKEMGSCAGFRFRR